MPGNELKQTASNKIIAKICKRCWIFKIEYGVKYMLLTEICKQQYTLKVN